MITGQASATNLISALAKNVLSDELTEESAIETIVSTIDRDTLRELYTGDCDAFEGMTDDDSQEAGMMWELVESAADKLSL